MGGKRTKFPAPPRSASVPEDVDTLARAGRHLERVLGLVEAAIDNGDANPAMIRESAGVARAIATLSAEQRAREKAAQAAEALVIREIDASTVIAYARSLASADRQRLVSALQALDGLPRSGLA